MYELKLRKRLLSQQLSVIDDKVDRMSRILDKKVRALCTFEHKFEASPSHFSFSSLLHTLPQLTMKGLKSTPKKKMETVRRSYRGGVQGAKPKKLMEVRCSFSRSCAGAYVTEFTSYTINFTICSTNSRLSSQPETIIPGSKIDLVRKRNVIRRHNEMEKRKPKPKPKMPRADPFAINRNVPVSLLPRRYTRGELPCTVEHRSSG